MYILYIYICLNCFYLNYINAFVIASNASFTAGPSRRPFTRFVSALWGQEQAEGARRKLCQGRAKVGLRTPCEVIFWWTILLQFWSWVTNWKVEVTQLKKMTNMWSINFYRDQHWYLHWLVVIQFHFILSIGFWRMNFDKSQFDNHVFHDLSRWQ